ncbi:sigma-70 family RNA polymerase sigma factor [Massilia sp. MB5]|uniref:sigma-70 family RNA polymerase sigma factor n=1 Tax=unclassified Massilia TaxID=2609279 RepID=UPI00067A8D82|nr:MULTISPECIES: sigma-70 family RNA polymerase sigma factor [unclassified Massilia]AKU24301.1 hypothetical protein ACZ75_25425 [Massilia sp. NR 4-1]UMR30705.1 sigma-70 family RNA polymerase sigma factor [Massilia sp. MB5]
MLSQSLNGKLVEDLREMLRSYGRRRFPALREEVDDLVAQTLADVWQYREEGSMQDGSGPEDAWRKLAHTVFRRRAADLFRRKARQEVFSLEDLPEAEQIEGAAPERSRALLYQRMLRICLRQLAEASREDRLLLTRATGLGRSGEAAEGTPGTGAMTARERQRLRRLRQALAEAIRRDLGEDARQLLRSDF